MVFCIYAPEVVHIVWTRAASIIQAAFASIMRMTIDAL